MISTQKKDVNAIGRLFQLSVLVSLLYLSSKTVAETPQNWLSYNYADTGFDFIQSQQAQDGTSLAVIDGTKLDFENYQLDRYKRIFPEGFLYQTLLADSYVGKHLHVSAFARNKAPDFEALSKQFEDAYFSQLEKKVDDYVLRYEGKRNREQIKNRLKKSLEDYEQQRFTDFSNSIRESYANSRYGVWALVHSLDDCSEEVVITLFEPTSTGNISSPELWHRFNVEVSVPLDALALSIVFWSTGVAISEVDHFAIVEHGPALKNIRASSHLDKFDSLYSDVRIKHIPEQTVFQNLSFEY